MNAATTLTASLTALSAGDWVNLFLAEIAARAEALAARIEERSPA